LTIETNINRVESFIDGPHILNDTTRVLIAPANDRRIRFDAYLDADILSHSIELYDAATGGNLIGTLDREFTGVMIRDNRFFSMDIKAISQKDIYAIIATGPSPYDILATEYIG